MNAGETAVICQICGHENEPDQRFCDECGAELNPETGPEQSERPSPQTLDVGAEITLEDERKIVIDRLLSLGKINRYLCKLDGQDAMLVEETATAPDFLKQRVEQLDSISSVSELWVPETSFTHLERGFAVGLLSGFPSLESRVRSSGPLSPESLRELALSLASLLDSLHGKDFHLRSLQPDRIWWNGSDQLMVDNFERLTAAANSSRDCQVVNGFSPPEAYGVGEHPVGPAADWYSVGAILHFSASAERTDLESRENFFSFPPLTNLDDEVFGGAVARLTAKNVEQRISDGQSLRDFLQREQLPEPTIRPLVPSAQPQQAAQSTFSSPIAPQADGSCRYEVFLQSHVGCVRSINQDACLEMQYSYIEKSEPRFGHLVVIIDGMGGEAEGDKAASIALRTVAKEVVDSSLCLKDERVTAPLLPLEPRERNKLVLERALTRANSNIYAYSERDVERRGMGCTITACIFEPNEVTLGHVGDTRAYLWREGALTRLTTDHSLVGRLVEMGQLTEEEARNSPQRSIIYRAMGTNPEVEVDLYHQELQVGDRLMVSSDGVWEYFMNEELERIMGQGDSPQPIANQLVELCLSRGADDNATLAVIFAR